MKEGGHPRHRSGSVIVAYVLLLLMGAWEFSIAWGMRGQNSELTDLREEMATAGGAPKQTSCSPICLLVRLALNMDPWHLCRGCGPASDMRIS